jgi:hypothetical protein
MRLGLGERRLGYPATRPDRRSASPAGIYRSPIKAAV